MPTLMSFLLRFVLVVGGAVFAASLAIAFTIMLALWGLRAVWARLTGRPVTPFVIRIDPRRGFDGMVRRAGQRRPPARSDGTRIRAAPGDVTDVEPRPPAP